MDFKFFLDFGLDSFGEIQITETFAFDGAAFTLEQEKGRFGRDITFGNEEINLRFEDGVFEKGIVPQQLPDGRIEPYLTMGLPYLLLQDKLTGFESTVYFTIKKDGITFTVGELDFVTRKTDGISYFECKVTQDSKRAIIHRRADTKCDVFSDKDMDMNPITPLVPTNILLKAKPILQKSKWKSHLRVNKAGGGLYVNTAQALERYGVENSYTPFSEVDSGFFGIVDAVNNFRIILAQESLSNISVHLDTNILFKYRTAGGNSSNHADIYLIYFIYPSTFTGYSQPNMTYTEVYRKTISGGSNQDFTLPTSFDFEIESIPKGYSLSLFWGHHWETVHIDDSNRTTWTYTKADVSISATSTAIDSIIKSVRYIDLFKQNIKSMSGLPVISSRFDNGGQFYEQFASSGYMIRGFSDKPFYVNFKDLSKGLDEVCADFQTLPEAVYINQYQDFYPNKDLGGFLAAPFTDFLEEYNDNSTLVNFEMKYATFELDREEQNTIDGVHTEAQWLLPNKKCQVIKKIDIPQIRDPFAIESARRQGIQTKDTTSLDGDDKLYLLDVIEMPPNTLGGFSSVLRMRNNSETGFLEILNSDGENEGTFNWLTIGVIVGASFTITGSNAGTYTVQEITSSVLTLNGSPHTFEGVEVITTSFPFSGIQYMNRTNEGFTLIENLESGDNFSNLRYTPRRNLVHWGPFWATSTKYKPDGAVSNTFFKNNGELRTQYLGGTIYQENETISVSNLSEAILSPKTVKTKLIVDFETITKLLEDLNTVNPDGSIGGFIRISDNNGKVLRVHPTKMDYEWASNVLDLTAEIRKENEFVEINNLPDGFIEINQSGYETSIVQDEWYIIDGNYVTLFDVNSVPLVNSTHFKFIKINGITFSNTIDIETALINL